MIVEAGHMALVSHTTVLCKAPYTRPDLSAETGPTDQFQRTDSVVFRPERTIVRRIGQFPADKNFLAC